MAFESLFNSLQKEISKALKSLRFFKDLTIREKQSVQYVKVMNLLWDVIHDLPMVLAKSKVLTAC